MKKNKIKEIGGEVPTNFASDIIETLKPFVVNVTVEGTSDFLFHRWNCEAIEEKANAAKGSKAKKTDNIESFVYRNDDNELCIPGEYFRQSIIHAAKYKQDPRSSRKSAMDLYKACIVPLTILAPLGKSEWDYEDKRRVVVQRAGINRTRPALKTGWKVNLDFLINIPEYVNPNDFYDTMATAGRLVGVGDFRPTYGRFHIINYKVLEG